jgi:serine protease Do
VIVGVDGRSIDSRNEVVRLISSKEPGSNVKLTVLRNGKEMMITARLADRAENLPLYAERGGEGEGSEGAVEPNERKLGIEVDDLNPQVLQQLGLPRETTGVVVTDISKVSESYDKGIDDGDVIAEVNRVPVKSVGDFRREIRKIKEGGLVVFYVISPPSRTGAETVSRYVTVRIQKGDD